MKSLRHSLLLVLFTLLLVCGLTLATTGRQVGRVAAAAPAIDCAGDCAAQRDRMTERCDKMSGPGAGKCREMAYKNYESCVQRCNGGGGRNYPGSR